LHRWSAEFGAWRVTDQGGKAGGPYGDSQDDAVLASQKDVRHVLACTRYVLDTQALSEERLPRIGYLGPLNASIVRVVERGIKK
jgi:hypothetical protein